MLEVVVDNTHKNGPNHSRNYLGPRAKRCTKCGVKKPITYFHMTQRKKNGTLYRYRHAKCAECRNKEKREWNRKRGITKNEDIHGSNQRVSTNGGVAK